MQEQKDFINDWSVNFITARHSSFRVVQRMKRSNRLQLYIPGVEKGNPLEKL